MNRDAPDAESYPIDRALTAPRIPFQKVPQGDSACVRCQVTWRTEEGQRPRCWHCGRFGVLTNAGTALYRWKRGCKIDCPPLCGIDNHVRRTHS